MDENETELLRLLYTRIGMRMEDASILAIDLGAPSSQFDPAKIAELKKSVETISKLMGAAQSIAESLLCALLQDVAIQDLSP